MIYYIAPDKLLQLFSYTSVQISALSALKNRVIKIGTYHICAVSYSKHACTASIIIWRASFFTKKNLKI